MALKGKPAALVLPCILSAALLTSLSLCAHAPESSPNSPRSSLITELSFLSQSMGISCPQSMESDTREHQLLGVERLRAGRLCLSPGCVHTRKGARARKVVAGRVELILTTTSNQHQPLAELPIWVISSLVSPMMQWEPIAHHEEHKGGASMAHR